LDVRVQVALVNLLPLKVLTLPMKGTIPVKVCSGMVRLQLRIEDLEIGVQTASVKLLNYLL